MTFFSLRNFFLRFLMFLPLSCRGDQEFVTLELLPAYHGTAFSEFERASYQLYQDLSLIVDNKELLQAWVITSNYLEERFVILAAAVGKFLLDPEESTSYLPEDIAYLTEALQQITATFKTFNNQQIGTLNATFLRNCLLLLLQTQTVLLSLQENCKEMRL